MDRKILYLATFLRALATGMIGVLMGIHLAAVGLAEAVIGIVVAAGLAGAASAALGTTLAGDRLGRRAVLIGLSILGAAGTFVFALGTSASVLLAASFLGMLNGMGRDRGAALILEHAILPATTSAKARTSAFAWYNLLQDAGHALGGLGAIVPGLLRAQGLAEGAALRAALALAGALILATAPLYFRLSSAAEAVDRRARRSVTPGTKRLLWKISSLFALDSLGGGFLTTALVSFYFYERFGLSEATLGGFFFAARVLNALSHLAAAWLAKGIGLVNTMVFTHIPSSILLLLVPFAGSFPVAALLFLMREALVEMDVPTRQSYVMAVVEPEERTVASGLTHLVRLSAWAIAPAIAGLLMQNVALGAPLAVGAGLKLVYDGLLYAAFRRVRPPEELPPSG